MKVILSRKECGRYRKTIGWIPSGPGDFPGIKRRSNNLTSKCRDIEVGTSILMGKDPTVVERIVVGVEEQAKEYQVLSNQMGKILQGLTRIKRDGQTAATANPQGDKEPKIKKELCPDTLTKDSI